MPKKAGAGGKAKALKLPKSGRNPTRAFGKVPEKAAEAFSSQNRQSTPSTALAPAPQPHSQKQSETQPQPPQRHSQPQSNTELQPSQRHSQLQSKTEPQPQSKHQTSTIRFSSELLSNVPDSSTIRFSSELLSNVPDSAKLAASFPASPVSFTPPNSAKPKPAARPVSFTAPKPAPEPEPEPEPKPAPESKPDLNSLSSQKDQEKELLIQGKVKFYIQTYTGDLDENTFKRCYQSLNAESRKVNVELEPIIIKFAEECSFQIDESFLSQTQESTSSSLIDTSQVKIKLEQIILGNPEILKQSNPLDALLFAFVTNRDTETELIPEHELYTLMRELIQTHVSVQESALQLNVRRLTNSGVGLSSLRQEGVSTRDGHVNAGSLLCGYISAAGGMAIHPSFDEAKQDEVFESLNLNQEERQTCKVLLQTKTLENLKIFQRFIGYKLFERFGGQNGSALIERTVQNQKDEMIQALRHHYKSNPDIAHNQDADLRAIEARCQTELRELKQPRFINRQNIDLILKEFGFNVTFCYNVNENYTFFEEPRRDVNTWGEPVRIWYNGGHFEAVINPPNQPHLHTDNPRSKPQASGLTADDPGTLSNQDQIVNSTVGLNIAAENLLMQSKIILSDPSPASVKLHDLGVALGDALKASSDPVRSLNQKQFVKEVSDVCLETSNKGRLFHADLKKTPPQKTGHYAWQLTPAEIDSSGNLPSSLKQSFFQDPAQKERLLLQYQAFLLLLKNTDFTPENIQKDITRFLISLEQAATANVDDTTYINQLKEIYQTYQNVVESKTVGEKDIVERNRHIKEQKSLLQALLDSMNMPAAEHEPGVDDQAASPVPFANDPGDLNQCYQKFLEVFGQIQVGGGTLESVLSDKGVFNNPQLREVFERCNILTGSNKTSTFNGDLIDTSDKEEAIAILIEQLNCSDVDSIALTLGRFVAKCGYFLLDKASSNFGGGGAAVAELQPHAQAAGVGVHEPVVLMDKQFDSLLSVINSVPGLEKECLENYLRGDSDPKSIKGRLDILYQSVKDNETQLETLLGLLTGNNQKFISHLKNLNCSVRDFILPNIAATVLTKVGGSGGNAAGEVVAADPVHALEPEPQAVVEARVADVYRAYMSQGDQDTSDDLAANILQGLRHAQENGMPFTLELDIDGCLWNGTFPFEGDNQLNMALLGNLEQISHMASAMGVSLNINICSTASLYSSPEQAAIILDRLNEITGGRQTCFTFCGSGDAEGSLGLIHSFKKQDDGCYAYQKIEYKNFLDIFKDIIDPVLPENLHGSSGFSKVAALRVQHCIDEFALFLHETRQDISSLSEAKIFITAALTHGGLSLESFKEPFNVWRQQNPEKSSYKSTCFVDNKPSEHREGRTGTIPSLIHYCPVSSTFGALPEDGSAYIPQDVSDQVFPVTSGLTVGPYMLEGSLNAAFQQGVGGAVAPVHALEPEPALAGGAVPFAAGPELLEFHYGLDYHVPIKIQLDLNQVRVALSQEAVAFSDGDSQQSIYNLMFGRRSLIDSISPDEVNGSTYNDLLSDCKNHMFSAVCLSSPGGPTFIFDDSETNVDACNRQLGSVVNAIEVSQDYNFTQRSNFMAKVIRDALQAQGDGPPGVLAFDWGGTLEGSAPMHMDLPGEDPLNFEGTVVGDTVGVGGQKGELSKILITAAQKGWKIVDTSNDPADMGVDSREVVVASALDRPVGQAFDASFNQVNLTLLRMSLLSQYSPLSSEKKKGVLDILKFKKAELGNQDLAGLNRNFVKWYKEQLQLGEGGLFNDFLGDEVSKNFLQTAIFITLNQETVRDQIYANL